jgi:uncharacterized protein (DUF2267 family)
VTYEEFIRIVQTHAYLEREHAVHAARVTLETLARRIARREAQDLAARLPPELGPSVWTDEEAEPFDVEELIRRVARREGVDLATAERHAQATFAALWQAVGAEEIGDVAAELSADYARLLPTGPAVEVEASRPISSRRTTRPTSSTSSKASPRPRQRRSTTTTR